MLGNDNQLIVVIRDERTKANNKLASIIGLSAIAFLLGSVMIKNAIEDLVIKIKEAKKDSEESEGE